MLDGLFSLVDILLVFCEHQKRRKMDAMVSDDRVLKKKTTCGSFITNNGKLFSIEASTA